jgi:hypothetical protein
VTRAGVAGSGVGQVRTSTTAAGGMAAAAEVWLLGGKEAGVAAAALQQAVGRSRPLNHGRHSLPPLRSSFSVIKKGN